MVVRDALVDVDADLAGPVDELDGQTLKKLLVRKLEKVSKTFYTFSIGVWKNVPSNY